MHIFFLERMDNKTLIREIVDLIKIAETTLPGDVICALERAYDQECGIAKIQIETMLKNIDVAKKTNRPLCQDTGVQTFFIEVGKDYPFIGQLKPCIVEAVKIATKEIPLRPNTFDPFTRRNHKEIGRAHV